MVAAADRAADDDARRVETFAKEFPTAFGIRCLGTSMEVPWAEKRGGVPYPSKKMKGLERRMVLKVIFIISSFCGKFGRVLLMG